MKKIFRYALISLVILVIIASVAIVGFASMIANALVYPNRQPLVKNPGDYGLTYEDVSIITEDGVTIAGWLMKGTGDRVAIITHPGTFTRYGFSIEHGNSLGYERDVELIPTAKHLVQAGYSVLMIDTRNHGESGPSPNGGVSHAGLEEYRDVVAAVLFVSEHPDLTNKDITLIGFCQGSRLNVVAMSKEPQILRQANVKANVVIQPLAYDYFIPGLSFPQWFVNVIEWQMIVRGSPPLVEMSHLPYAYDAFVPTLLVQALEDQYANLDHVRAVYDAFPEPKEAIWIEGEMHRLATYNWFNDHPEPLLDFLDKHMSENKFN